MTVTANDVYTLALSFMGEEPADDKLRQFSLPWLQLLLTEALPYENSVRRVDGRETLPCAPKLISWSDEIPYVKEIAEVALPYGLASFIFQDDDSEYRTQRYRSLYIAALNEAKKLEQLTVIDVYGGDEDA